MPCTCPCTCGYDNEHRGNKFWNEKTINSALNALVKAKIDVRYARFMETDKAMISGLVAGATGRELGPRALYNATIRSGISWRKALEKAGYSNSEKGVKSKNFWNRNLVIQCIKELRKEGHSLHTTGIRWDKSTAKNQLLFRAANEPITGQALFLAGQKFFGSWRNCLIAAGVDPKNVRLRRARRAKDRYAHLPLRFEITEVNGKQKTVGLLGFTKPNPEEEIIVSSQVDRIKRFLNKLKKEDGQLLKSLIRTLLNNSEADDVETAIRSATLKVDKAKRARFLFSQLKSYMTQ